MELFLGIVSPTTELEILRIEVSTWKKEPVTLEWVWDELLECDQPEPDNTITGEMLFACHDVTFNGDFPYGRLSELWGMEVTRVVVRSKDKKMVTPDFSIKSMDFSDGEDMMDFDPVPFASDYRLDFV